MQPPRFLGYYERHRRSPSTPPPLRTAKNHAHQAPLACAPVPESSWRCSRSFLASPPHRGPRPRPPGNLGSSTTLRPTASTTKRTRAPTARGRRSSPPPSESSRQSPRTRFRRHRRRRRRRRRQEEQPQREGWRRRHNP
ncbi:unnamed protein product, partial [Ectocarpus sp. 12 AP-2014]